jgi:integrase
MSRGTNKLTAKFIDRKDLKPRLYGDGRGLYLQVAPAPTKEDPRRVTKAWVFRFMIAGRARKMGLGEVDRIQLADVRKRAYAAWLQAQDGIDPIEERNARKAAVAVEKAKSMSFRECAEGYIQAHQSGWKNSKHGAQWVSTLETYAYPIIGSLPVGTVEDAHIIKILQPIWTTKTETASRVRGRIEKVLDRARALKLRTGENPAKWKGHLDQLLPARSTVAPVTHHAALPYRELPAFMQKLRSRESISTRALEFTILTAARTGDTIGAKWNEISESDRTWTIPGARLKGRRGARKNDHVIPLSDRALAILHGLPREGEYIFPGGKAGSGLSNMAMDQLLKGMGYESTVATVHGFRSSFKDWCSEQTSYPNEMSEMALAHTVSNKVEAAYRRGDMREKRRRLMQDWADYCGNRAANRTANVVSIRAGVES